MANYYCDITEGVDGIGTLLDPWNTLAGHVADLVAGDMCYLRGNVASPGQNWDEGEISITAGNGCANGTALNPITITTYNNEYVRFRPTSDYHIFVIDRDYWIFDGTDTNYRIEFDKNATADLVFDLDGDHNTFSYLEIHYGRGESRLISVDGDYNLFEYCEVYDNYRSNNTDAHGFYVFNNSSYNEWSHCTIYDCRGDCLQLQSDLGLMTNNIVHDCELYISAPLESCAEQAIDNKGNSTGFEVYDCVIHGFRDCQSTCGGTGADGEGIKIQGENTGVKIYRNQIYDVSGSPISIEVGSTDTVLVHHNVIYDLVFEASIGGKDVIEVYSGTVELHNNTIVGGNGAGAGDLFSFGANATVDIYNNIFEDTELININGAAVVNYDYNGWFSAAATLAGAHDETGVTAGFTNKGADDYTLALGSVCIDAGMDLGYPYLGTAPDQGAFEYNSSGGVPVVVVHITIVVVIVINA